MVTPSLYWKFQSIQYLLVLGNFYILTSLWGLIYTYYLYFTYDCFICMYVYHVFAWNSQRPEVGMRFYGTRVTNSCQQLGRYGNWAQYTTMSTTIHWEHGTITSAPCFFVFLTFIVGNNRAAALYEIINFYIIKQPHIIKHLITNCLIKNICF